MILEHYRDAKLKELYQKITRSDFKGDFEDDYVLCVMYAMRCIDRNQGKGIDIPENEYVPLAKEIIRIYETSEERDLEDLSIMSFTKKLFAYMKVQKKRYKDIHKMSTIDLMNELDRYADKE